MQAAAEAGSVLAWWATYKIANKQMPAEWKGPNGTAVAGAAAGLSVAAISLPLNATQFPETLRDLRALPYGKRAWNASKLATGHAVFFCVYEGLVKHIKAKNNYDAADVLGISWGSAVGALAYRAASVAFYTGPVANPLTSRHGLHILGASVAKMAFAVTLFELLDKWRNG